jgi:serine/threonine protein kinase
MKTEVAGLGDPTPVDPAITPSARRDVVPPHIPEVELSRVLGSGGMGTVYVGRAVDLDRPVAVKVIHADLAKHESFVKRFEREARALARLTHPGIVTCYHVGRTAEGARYLLMELVDGGDLLAFVRERGMLGVPEALSITRQIAEALAYAQTQGVIHRDVKPENILVVRSPPRAPGGGVELHAKLVDLGLAVFDSSVTKDVRITQAGDIMGSPLTVAPEQAEAPATADHRADIFALGATLYFALTGRFPHEGTTFAQILAKKVRDETPDPRELRPELDAAIARLVLSMLRVAPEQRPQTYSAVLAALKEIEEGRRAAERAKPLRAGAFLLALVAVLLLALGLGGAQREVPHSNVPVATPLPSTLSIVASATETSSSLVTAPEPPDVRWGASEALFGSEAALFSRWTLLPRASAWQPADEQGSCDGIAEGSTELALLELGRTPSPPWRLRVGIYPRSAREVGVRLLCGDEDIDASVQPLGETTVLLRLARPRGNGSVRPMILTHERRSGDWVRLTTVASRGAVWACLDDDPGAPGARWVSTAIEHRVEHVRLFVRRGSASFEDASLELAER